MMTKNHSLIQLIMNMRVSGPHPMQPTEKPLYMTCPSVCLASGPRIECVRDYPAGLGLRTLEQVNLSPKVKPGCHGSSSPNPIPSPRPGPIVRLIPIKDSLAQGIPDDPTQKPHFCFVLFFLVFLWQDGYSKGDEVWTLGRIPYLD